jgi:hypothetical protein
MGVTPLGDELRGAGDLASSSTTESNARRVLPLSTPVAAITSRTASKMRCGRSEARSRLRHNVNTVSWKP